MGRAILLTGTAIAILARASVAHAEAPSVALRAEVDVACTTTRDLRLRLAELGADVGEGDARVVLFVRIRETPDGRVEGELVLTDARGIVTTRRFVDRCDAVADALALAAAHTIEALPPEPSSPKETPAAPPVSAPIGDAAPSPAEKPSPTAAPSAGSGGVALLASATSMGVRSGSASGGIGLHALATTRIGRTRIGVAGAIAREKIADVRYDAGGPVPDDREAETARAGVTLGWYAPWDDTPVGLLFEAGVAWGSSALERPLPDRAPTTNRFVSPYVAPSVVLAVPVRFPVRPVALLGCLVTPSREEAPIAATAAAGLVWQGP